MRIISTNIAEPRTIEWRGKKFLTGIYKNSVSHPVFLGKEDVLNDHVIDREHHGGTDKACYMYSADHYTYWQQLYPHLEMPNGMFGENLTVKGLQETDINIGDVFKIRDALVQVTQPRQPCFKLGIRFGTQEVVKQFVNSGFAGVYVRVLQNGEIKVGDEMVLVQKKDSLSIQKVFELLYTNKFQKEKVIQALNDPFLAESCRKDLLKRWSSKL